MSRRNYLKRTMLAQFDPARFNCPNCGGSHNNVVSRKYLITQLRRCEQCELMFRTPTDPPLHNLEFYEDEYSQGFTTDLPTDNVLSEFLKSNFKGTEKDWSYYNDVLNVLTGGRSAHILDFGCSWGYGSYQMARAGHSVVSFEVAPTRRKYAQAKLGIDVINDMEKFVSDPHVSGTFDLFFSSHVLEHVPAPRKVFGYADKLLREGGLFICFTPNGNEAARKSNIDWEKWWGEVHPNFIDDRFLNRAFVHWPRMIGSRPVRPTEFPTAPGASYLDDLAGWELFFAAKKRHSLESV